MAHRAKSDINLGSLLRLFKSGFYDSWITVSYLYRYPDNSGVQDYLTNELYKLPDEDVEFYLFQLCNLLIQRKFGGTEALERFVLDRSSKSIHFALQLAWIFQATVEDPLVKDPLINEYCKQMREDVEISCVNVKRPILRAVRERLKDVGQGPSPGQEGGALAGGDSNPEVNVQSGSLGMDSYMNCLVKENSSSVVGGEGGDGKSSEVDFALGKSERSDYFNRLITFVDKLQGLSDRMRAVPIDQRQDALERELEVLNSSLIVDGTGLYLPITQANLPHFCIVHIVKEDAKVLNSRDRVPFLISLEVLKSTEPCSDPDLHKLAASHSGDILEIASRLEKEAAFGGGRFGRGLGAGSSSDHLDVEVGSTPPGLTPLSVMTSTSSTSPSPSLSSASSPPSPSSSSLSSSSLSSSQSSPSTPTLIAPSPLPRDLPTLLTPSTPSPRAESPTSSLSPTSSAPSSSSSSSQDQEDLSTNQPMKLPMTELWEDKKARIRKNSPFGHLPSWDLFSVIVKFGDDLRQEQLALQLVTQFHKIFQEANLPIYLRPYSILITSAESGLVETVLDTASLHQIKKNTPGYTNLDQYYKEVYEYPSDKYLLAQRNFVESTAGYSILTYLLQIKDRHNGNLLIDAEGHMIHIDFGFMLSNSPGNNMNFESAPFKLTQEFIDVMGGLDSSVFEYFKVLLIRGFIECRRHCEKIIFLVEMMQEGSNMPCFVGGQAAVDLLRQRFNLGATEDEYIQFVEGLITKSCNNWYTRQYDKFQYLTNGVRY